MASKSGEGMMIETRKNRSIVFLSFLIALMLTLLPLPSWAIWLNPAWVLLILIYWTMMIPCQINVGIACMMGICLDVLGGTLLGEHAFALVIVIYLVSRMHSRLRMFSLLQQGLIIFFLVLLYQFILFCIQSFLGAAPSSWVYWLCSLTSILLWPWICSVLRSWTYA